MSEPVEAAPPANDAYSPECKKALASVLKRRSNRLEDCDPQRVNRACEKDAIVIQCITVRMAPDGTSIGGCTVNDGGDRP